MKYWSIFLILFLSHLIMAQTEHSALLDGTIAYEKGDFETATKKFEKALERNSSSLKGNFNLGNSLYKRQKYDEAATYYQNAIEAAEGNKEKAQAFYNFGNTRLAQAKRSMQQQGQGPAMLDEKGQKHLKEAIDSYKNALRNNAQDYDAKNNLATAYKLLRQQQQQQQQQQQNKEQNQDQKNQDQKDQKNQQDKQENQQDKPSEKPKENQPIDNENQKNPADLEPQEMSKDEVDRLLEIIEQDDKKVQEKLMKRKRSKTKKPEKAW
ncbi:tetratricopeptide repeat protein [Aureispira sp. CCB-E]|uniref:tetratricopeptide repeat protein n=1 Tax=Aureispira sp. CCB-E TaxID=3051121 RepID=UPI0028697691|nr:tetratricopeptide repeat protein [Aureispira sp. CCB-E]WMX15118.1 tetratricopeptide repeat protein [Aureispira sp. CCB-E]